MRQEARDCTGNAAIVLKCGRVFDQETSSDNIGHCRSKAASIKRADEIELDAEANRRVHFTADENKLAQQNEDK